MFGIHTLVTASVLVALLVVVLRDRRHRLPRLLLAGVIVAPLGEIFPLAAMCVGEERINALLEGRLVGDSPEITSYSIDGIEISEDYMLVQQLFHGVAQVGFLLIAIGFVLLVNRLIRSSREIPHLP